MSAQGVGSQVVTGAAPISVGTSAVQIVWGRSGRKLLVVQNTHASQDLYLGGSTVATTTGLKVPAGQSLQLDCLNGDLWAVASGASTDVRVFEVY